MCQTLINCMRWNFKQKHTVDSIVIDEFKYYLKDFESIFNLPLTMKQNGCERVERVQ